MAAVDTNSPELGRNTSVNAFGSQAAQHSTAPGAGERAQGKEVNISILPWLTWLSFFQRLRMGESSLDQISLSNLQPAVTDLPRILSWEITWVERAHAVRHHAGREHGTVWRPESAHTRAILGSLSFCLNKTVRLRISILKVNIATLARKAAFYSGSTHCATMNASQPLFLFISNSTVLFISIHLNLTTSKYKQYILKCSTE